MQAIVLVGGFGTRLRTIVTDLPKPMAPIQDKPFLAHLLLNLKRHGITSVILPIHYMGEKIRDYFQSEYAGISIQYAEEEQPLGTGGAIVNALKYISEAEQPVFVLNGDTFLQLDYQAMYKQHQQSGTSLTMALRQIEDCSRYGKVITENNQILKFSEKGEAGSGWINAGVYLLHPYLFSQYHLPVQFSFENEFLFPYLNRITPQSFIANDYFIDIGIPEDYARAIHDLPALGK